jgi:hypothetical protein
LSSKSCLGRLGAQPVLGAQRKAEHSLQSTAEIKKAVASLEGCVLKREGTHLHFAIFQFFVAASLKMSVFWCAEPRRMFTISLKFYRARPPTRWQTSQDLSALEVY